VSDYLHKHLHAKLEECKVEDIPSTIDAYRSLGGYLKRYRGGPLERFREPDSDTNDIKGIALDEAAVLAFLEVGKMARPIPG
jgi:protein phosphatase PTC6